MQRDLPKIVKVSAFVLSLPICLHRIVRGLICRVIQDIDDFVRSLASIERHDQRLDDTDSSIVGARIAPGFKIVRLRNVPVAPCRGLIRIKPQVCPELHLLESVEEIEVGWRVVDRVAAQNQQCLHGAIPHVLDQLREGRDLIHGIRLYWIRVDYRLPCVAQGLIDRVNDSVDRRRLILPCDHDASSAMRLKVFEYCPRFRGIRARPASNAGREVRHAAGSHAEVMVSHAAGNRRSIFGDVQPRRNRVRILCRGTPSGTVIADITQAAGRSRA